MGKPVYVLGTALSHNGAACLLKDGELVVAIEKERITRTKHDGYHDQQAIDYCLAAGGLAIEDVALLVQNANFGMFRYGHDWFRGPRNIPSSLPVVTISHHLAHAYAALGTSPFESAAALVIDGCGNAFDECVERPVNALEVPAPEWQHLVFEKDSVYVTAGNQLQAVAKDFSAWGYSHRGYPMHPNTTQHSIGGLYLAASMYVFAGFEDPGKLMGLAPYGRKDVITDEIFELKDGRVYVRYDWMDRFRRPARTRDALNADFQYYADIAHWIQREVERAILYVAAARRALVREKDLCYAGGVALNAVANRRLLNEAGFDRVHIPTAAGDNGVALGCAFYGWIEVVGGERVVRRASPYLGRRYAAAHVEAALETQIQLGGVEVERVQDVEARSAGWLADGKVIGWYQGAAEFGPRALGNRSILADPRIASIRNHINRRIKLREDFRPFAPTVLQEEAARYFEIDAPSPYMLLVAMVRPEWRECLAAVVHADGTSRLQTLCASDNDRYFRLLMCFKEQSGIGMLLNTSLNRKGMAIVETPQQALEFFASSALDALVVHDYVVTHTTAAAAVGPEGGDRLDLVGDRLTQWATANRRLARVVLECPRLELRPRQPIESSAAELVIEISQGDLGVVMRSDGLVLDTFIECGRVRVGNADARDRQGVHYIMRGEG